MALDAALLERSSSETKRDPEAPGNRDRLGFETDPRRALFFSQSHQTNSKLLASWRIARAGPGNGLRLVEGILFFPLAFGQRARLRAHRAHRSTRPAPVATPQPQKQWPLSAPPLPSSPPAPRSPGTSSIAPARAFPGRERVGSGNVSSSDARAARRRDKSSSRATAPHARATSRLTAPSPSPAPPSTANSPPRPRTRLASPSACARRYVRPALERHPSPMARFRFPVARLPGARRPATAATHENTPRRSRRSLSARAHRPVRSPPRPPSRPPQDEAAPAEKAPEEKKPEPIGPPRGSKVRLSP